MLSSLTDARRSRRANGNKTLNTPCTWKFGFDSECVVGHTCQTGNNGARVCKVEYLGACRQHTDCASDNFCEPDKRCHALPITMNQVNMHIASDIPGNVKH
jgi:hypothetical protein